MANILRHIILLLVFMAGFSVCAQAQFKEEAFTQTYNEPDDTTATNDTSDKMFSFKELFGGVAHKRDLRIGTMFAGSVVMPGISQIYNRDYWKLPVIYGGIGVCAGLGGHYLHQYNLSKKAYDAAYAQDPNTTLTVNTQAKATGTILLVGAGLIYWGSLMDGVVNYKKDIQPHPGRATLYSVLLPGLGQAYNGEYWKIPIYWQRDISGRLQRPHPAVDGTILQRCLQAVQGLLDPCPGRLLPPAGNRCQRVCLYARF